MYPYKIFKAKRVIDELINIIHTLHCLAHRYEYLNSTLTYVSTKKISKATTFVTKNIYTFFNILGHIPIFETLFTIVHVICTLD